MALVLGLAHCTQFPHVAEDRQFRPIAVHGCEILQGSGHAGRVGVVGVQDQLIATRVGEL